MIIDPYRFAVAGYAGPLDAYATNLWSAPAIKRLLGSYSGSLIRVRRSSDNAEQDIGYLTDGSLDITALASFVGSNSAYVTIMYDQSGNGRHLVQATSSLQPRIVNAGTYDGFLRFDGSDDRMAYNTSTPVVTGLGFGSRYAFRSLATNQTLICTTNIGGSGHNTFAIQAQTDGLLYGYLFEGTGAMGDQWNETTTERGYLFDLDRTKAGGSRLSRYANGALDPLAGSPFSGATPSPNSAETLYVGARGDGTLPGNLNLKIAVLWSATQYVSAAAISSAL